MHCKDTRIERKRGVETLEGLLVPALQLQLIIVEVLLADHFILHVRLLVVLQQYKNLKVLNLVNYLLVYLLYGVLTSVILVVRFRLSIGSHTHKEIILCVVILGI